MTAAELAKYISGSNAPFCEAVLCALRTSPRFEQFVETYRDKIRKKIRNTNNNHDAVKPVLAELWVAYLLLQVDQFSHVKYEAYGTRKRSPDLTATHCGSGSETVFNVEVKRIRETDSVRRFKTWRRQVQQRIKEIPSGLALNMNIGDVNTPVDLLDRLEAQSEDIIRYITTTIVAHDKDIPLGSKKAFFVPGFEEVFKFRLRRSSWTSTIEHTSIDWVGPPGFATHNEFRKLGDEICDPAHLGQMLPGMINVLAITTHSSTHDELDLEQALDSLGERAANGDDQFFINKRFRGTADFITQLERLSGILLVGAYFPVRSGPTVLWSNNKAKFPLTKDVGNLLQAMVCQNRRVSFQSVAQQARGRGLSLTFASSGSSSGSSPAIRH